MEKYLVIDLETNTVEKYGRKANFMFNEIVAVGIAQNKEAAAKYIYGQDFQKLDLEDVDVIIGHNIGFDLLYLWKYDWLQDYFKSGGKIFCTQLAHYILTGQEDKYPALRDIAVRCYSCPEREKLMEPYWEDSIKIMNSNNELLKSFQIHAECDAYIKLNQQHIGKFNGTVHQGSIQTSDIPKELVLEDVKNDVLDTESIYLQQVIQAEKQGQTKLIELQMDALLATTEASYNGMRIDLDMLHKNKLELEKKLDRKKAELDELIKPWWR